MDCDPAFASLSLTDEIFIVPRASDEEAYIQAVRRIVAECGVSVILPNNSLEARVLALHASELGAPLRLPSIETLETANSKWISYQRWSAAGIPVPRTLLLRKPENVQHAFDLFESRPVWVRGAGIPGSGIGGAALPCKTVAQAREWVGFHDGWNGMIASEFLPGDNLTWIALFDQGRLITSQCRQRDRYVIPHVSPSGITGAPALSHTLSRSDAHETALAAALALDTNLDGVVFIDMKCDEANVPRVTEMNAGRFGTTHFFYTAAGLNLPWLLVQLALGHSLPDLPQENPLPDDLYWVRTLDAGPVLISGDDLRAHRLDQGQRFDAFGRTEGSPPPVKTTKGL
jgi:carbamoyl-phosphate synthase large subunit